MNNEIVVHENPKSPISEIFRTLRTNLQFASADKKVQTILVTSTMPGEGKSYVASNLAVTFAQSDKKVLIIDADMRKGRQYKILGASPKPGLSNCLSDLEEMDNVTEYIQTSKINNLFFMAAGNIPPNPSELLSSSKMKELLDNLKSAFDFIIIDGTPIELVTDSAILSRIIDTTVVVVNYKKTKREILKKTVESIQNVGGNISGIIVNKVNISTKKYQQSYYYGNDIKK